ncbi:hypothetical protein OSB04_003522, partial [Centaurea solstitialis]
MISSQSHYKAIICLKSLSARFVYVKVPRKEDDNQWIQIFDLAAINETISVLVGRLDPGSAFQPGKPTSRSLNDLLELLSADPAIFIGVELHQPSFELLNREFSSAVVGVMGHGSGLECHQLDFLLRFLRGFAPNLYLANGHFLWFYGQLMLWEVPISTFFSTQFYDPHLMFTRCIVAAESFSLGSIWRVRDTIGFGIMGEFKCEPLFGCEREDNRDCDTWRMTRRHFCMIIKCEWAHMVEHIKLIKH